MQGDVAGFDHGRWQGECREPAYIDALSEGLDRAEEHQAIVLLGRVGVFSRVRFERKSVKDRQKVRLWYDRGAALLFRLFTFPLPVVAASAGHAIAAGALLLLASDTRIGVGGDAKYGLNETAIGMSLPPFGLQMGLCRLSKRHQTEAMIQARLYDAGSAQNVGYLDQVVPLENLDQSAIAAATNLAELPTKAYAAMKLDVRKQYIDIIAASLA